MTSAEFCTARTGSRQFVPSFQASFTDRSVDGTHAAYADFPG